RSRRRSSPASTPSRSRRPTRPGTPTRPPARSSSRSRSSAGPAPRPHPAILGVVVERRHQILTLVATILGSTIVFLDATVVNVALPSISEDLHGGLADQQWVVAAYLLALVSLMLVGGSLGDQFGRRRMFLIGLVGFAITSAACAIAPSSRVLIAARGAQGLAG